MLLAFGDYVLDSGRRELRRGAEPVAVEPQVFDLLLYLVQQRDRLVSKDDLLQAVWGGRIVSDSALAARINAARRALGDNGEAQRWIRTLPRKGVRFIGAVREEQEPAPASSPLPRLAQPTVAPRLSIVVLPFAKFFMRAPPILGAGEIEAEMAAVVPEWEKGPRRHVSMVSC